MDDFSFTLHSPLTDEEWDLINDVDFNNTHEITFRTKHGKQVTFVKAQPQRKKGKWITDDLSGIISCNQCGNDAPMETIGGRQYESKFCPSCGADMRGEDNG